MMTIYHKFKNILQMFGFNPTVFINFFRGMPIFLRNLSILKKQLKLQKSNDFVLSKYYIVLDDWFNSSGSVGGQYFHQDIVVARKIFHAAPVKHVDIGSRVDGFVTHVAVFREIEVFDIRPQSGMVKNIIFKQADLMKLPEGLKNYCDSISSLHAIEHFGLGRYGDPVDVDGHIKGLNSIYEILKSGGIFYFSVPIGKQRIEYNGHRVFDVQYLVKLFAPKYIIKNFSYIDDAGNIHEDVPFEEKGIQSNFGCYYGCGIFELLKK